MSFEKLMDDLQTLAKSQAAADDNTDGKIAAAAGAEGAAAGAAGAEGGAGAGAAAGAAGAGEGSADEEGKGKEIAKSMTVTLADGTTAEAVDGVALVKSLLDRIEGNESQTTAALTALVDLAKSQAAKLNELGTLAKSLSAEVEALRGAGAGRKALLTIAEVPSVLKKSQAELAQEKGIAPHEFMTKALAAQAAGKLLGSEVARAEAYLNRGLAVPAEIVSKVAAHQQ